MVNVLQTASDIQRDGLGVNLMDAEGNQVVEIFRCDKDNSVVINTFGNDIELAEFNRLLAYAKAKLGTFENGTTIHWESLGD